MKCNKPDGKNQYLTLTLSTPHEKRGMWNKINKLSGRKSIKAKYPLSSNAIAKQIVANGIFMKRDKTFTQEVKREVSNMKMRPLLFEQEHLKKYCSKSVLLMKRELLEVIKRCLKYFSPIPFIRENTI